MGKTIGKKGDAELDAIFSKRKDKDRARAAAAAPDADAFKRAADAMQQAKRPKPAPTAPTRAPGGSARAGGRPASAPEPPRPAPAAKKGTVPPALAPWVASGMSVAEAREAAARGAAAPTRAAAAASRRGAEQELGQAAGVPDKQPVVFVGGSVQSTGGAVELLGPACGALSVSAVRDWASGAETGVRAVELGSASALREALRVGKGAPGALVAETARGAAGPGSSLAWVGQVSALLSEAERYAESPAVRARLRRGALSERCLDLLACLGRDAARRALRELADTLASLGEGGGDATALLARVLARRRAADPGTVRWAGSFNGLPLPEGPARRLEQVLGAIDWKAMGNVRAKSINVQYSFSLGMATKALEKSGPFCVPFAFKQGMGVWDGASVRKKHKEVWEAAMAVLRSVDPTFHCTSIGFNYNFKGSPHRDEKDAGPQVATSFGDFEGGALRVYGQEGIIDVNTKRRFCRFDGRYRHEVLPFQGTRYSVIFYQLEPPYAVDMQSTVEGAGGKGRKAASASSGGGGGSERRSAGSGGGAKKRKASALLV